MFMHGARLMPGSACPMSTCHWDLLAQLVSAPILIHAGIFVDEGSLSMGWRSPGRAAASNEFGNSLLAALERRAAALHSDGRLYLRFLGRVQYWLMRCRCFRGHRSAKGCVPKLALRRETGVLAGVTESAVEVETDGQDEGWQSGVECTMNTLLWPAGSGNADRGLLLYR